MLDDVDDVNVRTSILIALRHPENLLAIFEPRGSYGILFCRGFEHLTPGVEVDIEVAFQEPKLTFSTRGIVRWKRTAPAASLKAGVGVEFLEEEVPTRDLMLRFARGEPVPELRVRERRFPASIPVSMQMAGARLEGKTFNMSFSGAFLLVPRPPEEYAVVPLTLLPQDARRSLTLDAEVRWQRVNGVAGMGVRFLFDTDERRDAVKRLVEEIRRNLV